MHNSRWFSRAALLMAACGSIGFAQQGQIAILNSANSVNYFGLHYSYCDGASNYLGGQEFDRYLDGWEYTLQNARIPFTEITDSQVTDGTTLASFQVLILPNAPSISNDETKAIQQWVIGGGQLLATFGSGYEGIISQSNLVNLQKGGTNGLHNLWHDPLSNVVTSQAVLNPPGVDVQITQFVGPTLNVSGLSSTGVLPYGALANMLVQRPPNYPDAYAFFVVNPAQWTRPAPAILVDSMAHGSVVYFAFAPEYLVALEFAGAPPLPANCPGFSTVPWQGRSEAGASLMVSTVNYLLGLSSSAMTSHH